jgi:hypothetical protein
MIVDAAASCSVAEGSTDRPWTLFCFADDVLLNSKAPHAHACPVLVDWQATQAAGDVITTRLRA